MERNKLHCPDERISYYGKKDMYGNNSLIDNASDQHIITNGTWQGTTAKPGKEPGAPTVNQTISGINSSATIGPFTTAGTFQLYCTIHQGMNLTVIVQ